MLRGTKVPRGSRGGAPVGGGGWGRRQMLISSYDGDMHSCPPWLRHCPEQIFPSCGRTASQHNVTQDHASVPASCMASHIVQRPQQDTRVTVITYYIFGSSETWTWVHFIKPTPAQPSTFTTQPTTEASSPDSTRPNRIQHRHTNVQKVSQFFVIIT